MCLAIPMQITQIEGDIAVCEVNNISLKASLALVPQARIGDWVIVHAGFAIEILDEAEAEETIRIFEELEEAFSASAGNGSVEEK